MLLKSLIPAFYSVKNSFAHNLKLTISAKDERTPENSCFDKIDINIVLGNNEFKSNLPLFILSNDNDFILKALLLDDELEDSNVSEVGPSEFQLMDQDGEDSEFFLNTNEKLEDEAESSFNLDQVLKDPIYLNDAWGELYKYIFGITGDHQVTATEMKSIYMQVDGALSDWVSKNTLMKS